MRFFVMPTPILAAIPGLAALFLGRRVERTDSAGHGFLLGIAGAAHILCGPGCHRSQAAASWLRHGGKMGQDQRVEEKRRSGTEDLASELIETQAGKHQSNLRPIEDSLGGERVSY
jgi:hypothetical protein